VTETEPCIPTLAAKPPFGPDWVHEIKHDGYRLIVRRDGAAVRCHRERQRSHPIPHAQAEARIGNDITYHCVSKDVIFGDAGADRL
jgi:hypothetical protein